MRVSRFLLFGALSSVIFACGSTSHVLIGTPRTPVALGEVRVYSEPPANYETIAMISASSRNSLSFGDQAKMDKAMQRLREDAAALGANGVLLQALGTDQRVVGSVADGSGSVVTTSHKTVEAIAIYVLDGQAN